MRKHFLQTIRMAASIMVALLGDDDQSIIDAVNTIESVTPTIDALEHTNERMQILAARLQMIYLMRRGTR